jgi:uncharacterized protein YggU (UPF0235/DUF167 family)
MAAGRPWRIEADGLALLVRLTPKAGRDAVDGIAQLSDGTVVLRTRIRAIAPEGAANAALQKLIAGVVAVAPRRVQLVAGLTGRAKRLKIAGDGAQLAAALEMRVNEATA